MKIIHYSEAEARPFGSPARDVTGRVVVGKADGAANFCMRVIELAPGGYTPHHAHPWEHEQFVHAGQGSVLMNDQWVDFGPGSVLFIPADEEHQFKNTGKGPLVIVCLVPPLAPEL
jgi:quercetin dioxygenase-like cupin family protein